MIKLSYSTKIIEKKDLYNIKGGNVKQFFQGFLDGLTGTPRRHR